MEHDIILISSNNQIGQKESLLYSILASYFASPGARQALAQSMIAPIRTCIDYSGISRKIFVVEQLPAGSSTVFEDSG